MKIKIHNLTPKPEYYYHPSPKPLPEYLSFPISTYNMPPENDGPDSSLEAILSSKKDLLRQKMSLLSSALYERREVLDQAVSSIYTDMTSTQAHIFALEYSSYFRLTQDWEKKKMDLSRDLRRERSQCFKDLVQFRQSLIETQIEYAREIQTEVLFQ